ncbi:hypothetical protein RvY_16807 [Ramazzottius varieornatus]|uniref:G-protein coupled receptors family 1 profile domain-containing protein n=1 Tax=Ramazzottius varieornatus TaxID=947166 RepID=A0A1D1W0V9_RAMVA|nr:hypothetical protein RvY_16807 [Ramazzottius varieornatus]
MNSSEPFYQLQANLTQTFDGPNWTFDPCFALCVLASALSTTSSVLYLFIHDRSIVTPFTIFFLNLLIANLMLCIFFYPFFLVDQLYLTWPIGNSSCTLYQYSAWVIAGALCNTHALIALNRFWAVYFPDSYRRKHKKKLAFYICLGMWIYLNVGCLPGVILDHLWYRPPVEIKGCNFVTDAPASWLWTVQLVYFDFPILLVLGVYPLVCWKAIKRVRRTIRPVNEGLSETAARQVSSLPQATDAAKSPNGPHQARPNVGRCFQFELRGVGRGVPVLSAMTLMVLIVYFPDQLAYTLQMMLDVNIDPVLPVVSKLYLLSTILDPVMFVLTVKKVRQTFRRVYFCGL